MQVSASRGEIYILTACFEADSASPPEDCRGIDHQLHVYDLAGKGLRRFTVPSGYDVAVDEEGGRAYVAGEGDVSSFDLATGSRSDRAFPGGEPLAWHASSRTLIAVADGQTVIARNMRGDDPRSVRLSFRIDSIAPVNGGSVIVVGHDDEVIERIALVAVRSSSVAVSEALGDDSSFSFMGMIASPESDRVMVLRSGAAGHEIQVRRVRDLRVIRRIIIPISSYGGMAWIDPTHLALGDISSRIIRIVNTANGTVRTGARTPIDPEMIATLPSGKLAIATHHDAFAIIHPYGRKGGS